MNRGYGYKHDKGNRGSSEMDIKNEGENDRQKSRKLHDEIKMCHWCHNNADIHAQLHCVVVFDGGGFLSCNPEASALATCTALL